VPGRQKPVPRPLRTPAKPVRSTQGLAHGPAPRAARPGRVSLTSAQRFARRVRARRRRRALIGSALVLALAGLAWATLRSPWATVQRVEVSGTHRVPASTVRAAAGTEIGHPMLLARTADVRARVGKLRLIRSVRVERHWPGTIRVRVVERTPVAALPSRTGFALVDVDGVVIDPGSVDPAGLPELQVALGASGVPAMRGALGVLAQLPPAVSDRLLSIGARSPDGIWLRLREKGVKGGVRVEWGSSAQTPRKAEVLTALLRQHADGYDVRSPDQPALRGG
jgi:cell division protein FtsQ